MYSKKELLVLIMAVSFVITLGACTDTSQDNADHHDASIEDVKKETKDVVESIGELTQAQVDAYKQTIDKQLETSSEKLEELKGQASSAAGTAKEEMQKTVDTLENKLQELREESKNLSAQSAEAWEKTKASINSNIKKIDQSLDDVADDLLQEKVAVYKETLNKRLAELTDELQRYKEKAGEATEEAKADLTQVLEDLKEQLNNTREKSAVLKAQSIAAWGETKDGMSKALDELEAAFKRAAAKFDTNSK